MLQQDAVFGTFSSLLSLIGKVGFAMCVALIIGYLVGLASANSECTQNSRQISSSRYV